jgi:hypothetical protein
MKTLLDWRVWIGPTVVLVLLVVGLMVFGRP